MDGTSQNRKRNRILAAANGGKEMNPPVGKRILGRLKHFTVALKQRDKKPISRRFTCRRVILDLEPTPYDPDKVKMTRSMLGASQAMFAKFLGVKVKTVQSWEQGTQPSDLACRFMDEIRHNPSYWLERFEGAVLSKA